MSNPDDSAALRQLEEEALQCERSDDFLGALDIYEAIVRRGLAGPRQLTALGFCYLKNRQRQNAKEIWLRAVQIDVTYQPSRDALNKYFPGWEKQPAAPLVTRPSSPPPSSPPPSTPPPPPPPLAFASKAEQTQLSIETIMPASATSISQSRGDATIASEAPPQMAAAAPKPQPVRAAAKPKTAEPAPKPERVELGEETRVNWGFVMDDGKAEMAVRR